MDAIEMYSTRACRFCWAAKALFERKGLAFTEIDVSGRPDIRERMVERAGGRTTTPQIFIGDLHVGGYSDLAKLEAEGQLDRIIGRK